MLNNSLLNLIIKLERIYYYISHSSVQCLIGRVDQLKNISIFNTKSHKRHKKKEEAEKKAKETQA